MAQTSIHDQIGLPYDRQCRICGAVKPLSEFYRHKKCKQGLSHWCKPCTNARNRAYKASRPPLAGQSLRRQRKQQVARFYGISIEHHDALMAKQGGLCAICLQPPTRTFLDVDHDHRTGQIRGLLCARCNKALGHFKDDTIALQAAADYLQLHKDK